MSKPYKLLLFTIILAVVSITIIIYRYEQLLDRQKKEAYRPGSALNGASLYTATEIIELIKESKEYLGDSLTIVDNGQIVSSNPKFQGTIKAVLDSKDNMDIVHKNAKTSKLPLQYNVYVLAAIYYRQQYASEFKKQ